MAPLPPLNRRGLVAGALAGLGASALVAACGDSTPAAKPVQGERKVVYGTEHADQFGLFAQPAGTPVGLAVLVHGGYWSDQYGLDLMQPMAADLRRRGYATWNIEYRRIGSGGGFPATFTDVAAAYDKVRDLALPKGTPVIALGHSAGGQLAVWAASRTTGTPGGRAEVVPGRTISLSGVLDLNAGAAEQLGGGAVQALMGREPDKDVYPQADPCLLVPAQGDVVAVHARDDEIVPPDQSTTYVRLDQAAGGRARLVPVPGGHFDLIDPGSKAWSEIVTLL